MPEWSIGLGLGPSGLVPSWVRILLPAFLSVLRSLFECSYLMTKWVEGSYADFHKADGSVAMS